MVERRARPSRRRGRIRAQPQRHQCVGGFVFLPRIDFVAQERSSVFRPSRRRKLRVGLDPNRHHDDVPAPCDDPGRACPRTRWTCTRVDPAPDSRRHSLAPDPCRFGGAGADASRDIQRHPLANGQLGRGTNVLGTRRAALERIPVVRRARVLGDSARNRLYGAVRLDFLPDRDLILYAIPLSVGSAVTVAAMLSKDPVRRQLGAALLLLLSAGYTPRSPSTLIVTVLGVALLSRAGIALAQRRREH